MGSDEPDGPLIATSGYRGGVDVGKAGSPFDRVTLVGTSLDGDRVVDFSEDGPVLPESTRDDTDAGWGERPYGNDDRLRDERPPHWD
jgi:hypothetical protein